MHLKKFKWPLGKQRNKPLCSSVIALLGPNGVLLGRSVYFTSMLPTHLCKLLRFHISEVYSSAYFMDWDMRVKIFIKDTFLSHCLRITEWRHKGNDLNFRLKNFRRCLTMDFKARRCQDKESSWVQRRNTVQNLDLCRQVTSAKEFSIQGQTHVKYFAWVFYFFLMKMHCKNVVWDFGFLFLIFVLYIDFFNCISKSSLGDMVCFHVLG